MPKDLSVIGKALDEISWLWLADNFPGLADAIQDAVQDGVDSDQVRRYVMARVHRPEIALRCEQAARYLATREG